MFFFFFVMFLGYIFLCGGGHLQHISFFFFFFNFRCWEFGQGRLHALLVTKMRPDEKNRRKRKRERGKKTYLTLPVHTSSFVLFFGFCLIFVTRVQEICTIYLKSIISKLSKSWHKTFKTKQPVWTEVTTLIMFYKKIRLTEKFIR